MLLSTLKQEYLFNLECRKLSPKTVYNYGLQLKYLFDFLAKQEIYDLEDVKTTHIKQFIMCKQANGNKEQYINDLLKAFRGFFKYVYEEEYVDRLITEKIKDLKQPKVIIKTFNEKQIQDMVNYYKGKDFMSIRNKTIIATFFDTGIRLTELMDLTIDRVYIDYMLINGKGNKQRIVPKSPYLSKLIIKYLTARETKFIHQPVSNHLFLSKNGKQLTHEAVEKLIRDTGKAIGATDIRCSPHTLRHTFAQTQLKNGCDLFTLSRMLGHENISITQRYLEGIKDDEIITSGNKHSVLMNLK